jgi:hypothetical protein
MDNAVLIERIHQIQAELGQIYSISPERAELHDQGMSASS